MKPVCMYMVTFLPVGSNRISRELTPVCVIHTHDCLVIVLL